MIIKSINIGLTMFAIFLKNTSFLWNQTIILKRVIPNQKFNVSHDVS